MFAEQKHGPEVSSNKQDYRVGWGHVREKMGLKENSSLSFFLHSPHFTLATLHHLPIPSPFPHVPPPQPSFHHLLQACVYYYGYTGDTIFLLSKTRTCNTTTLVLFLNKPQIRGYHHNSGQEAGGCWGTRYSTPQDVTLVEMTQLVIPVCQVRLHVHDFQAGEEEWPVKPGHGGKAKLDFQLFSLFFPLLSLPHASTV